MDALRKPLHWYENFSAAAAGILMLVMMLLTAVDVVMRYVFNTPLAWAFDLVTHYLLVAAFFFSFSIALRMGEHVAVDFFVRKFHPGARRAAMALAWTACGILAGVITVAAAHEAWLAWRQGEVIAGVIPWPVWVQKAVIALGMAPLTIRLLLLSIGAVPAGHADEAAAALQAAARG